MRKGRAHCPAPLDSLFRASWPKANNLSQNGYGNKDPLGLDNKAFDFPDRPGEEVTLTYLRDGEEATTELVLDSDAESADS